MKELNLVTAMKKVSKRLVEKKRIEGAEQYKFPVNFEFTLPTFIEYGLPESDKTQVVMNVRANTFDLIIAFIKGFQWATGVSFIAGGKMVVVSTDTPALTGDTTGVNLVDRANDLDAIASFINKALAEGATALSTEATWKTFIGTLIAGNLDAIQELTRKNKELEDMLGR